MLQHTGTGSDRSVPSLESTNISIHRFGDRNNELLLGITMKFENGVIVFGFCEPHELFDFMVWMVDQFEANYTKGG